MSKLWREAASLIIAVRSNVFRAPKETKNIHENVNCNFKILVLKRGKSSRFFPGGYVFPGGVVEEADSKAEWLNIFVSNELKTENFKSSLNSSPQSSLYTDDEGHLPKQLALRITAIRETFEECGILLCKNKQLSTPCTWASFLVGKQLHEWQKNVQKDANNFINLCTEFECIPDIWALHQWSNWLTPTNNPTRFDTGFFLATMDQLPPSVINESEMDDMKWCSPKELLEINIGDPMWLPPPQYYEISRIVKHSNIEQLNSHAVQRSTYGCERWMPIQKKADDGIICFLPGDDDYPSDVNYNIKDEMAKIKGTMTNLRNSKHKVHRMELSKNGARIFISNIEPRFGHLLPFEMDSISK